MDADPSKKPAVKSAEAEALDFVIVDEGGGDSALDSSADFSHVTPETMAQVFRGFVKEKLKRWCFRSLLWGGGLGLLATEHTWARWAFGIWATIAAIHLALLLFSWRVAGRGPQLLKKMFTGRTDSGSDGRHP